MKRIILILIMLSLTPSLSYSKKNATGAFDIISLKKEISPLDLSLEKKFSPSTEKYFNYYNINFNGIQHYFGWFASNQHKIATHVFLPEKPKGTIVILHGYFDHTGEIQSLINLCLRLNFAVVTPDLPGHGLSSGERGAIDDFNEYASVLDTFIKRYKSSLPEPFHLIGHSTGCAAAYEFLCTEEENLFNKIIFLAPLVRSNHFQSSKIAFFLLHSFIKKIPRRYTKNSGNKSYLEFVKKDPLEVRYISARWFKALCNWNQRIEKYKTIKNPALIIQGDADKTIEWKYNLNFFKKKFDDINIRVIKNARHHLPNESPALQSQIFKAIEQFL